MEMLLMGACLSVFGLAVCCLAFGAATRDSEYAAAAAPAECFLESPNASLLHSRTMSTLVN